ncbi:hypothetical protein ACGFS9_09415 [Streptomyces sp. NPDC048566]|uniref:hypothetical protein n=1 Tax=Streptomyces sp. NPDC048566 TaxID=3365569 RepID=UPI00372224B7
MTRAPYVDGTAVARVTDAHGNRQVDIPGGLRDGLLSVAVDCRGEGTMTVSVRVVGLSFPVECTAGEVTGVYNRLRLHEGRDRGTVSVSAPSGVHWALTVGR